MHVPDALEQDVNTARVPCSEAIRIKALGKF
jgi:hypothetical protein